MPEEDGVLTLSGIVLKRRFPTVAREFPVEDDEHYRLRGRISFGGLTFEGSVSRAVLLLSASAISVGTGDFLPLDRPLTPTLIARDEIIQWTRAA